MSEPRGPVYLDAAARGAGQSSRRTRGAARCGRSGATAPEPARAAIEEAAALIAKAEFPLIVTSSVGRNPAAIGELAALAQEFAIPVVQTEARDFNLSDRPSDESRLRAGRLARQGRRDRGARQRGAVDSAHARARQGRQDHPHLARSAVGALSVPRDRGRPADHRRRLRGAAAAARSLAGSPKAKNGAADSRRKTVDRGPRRDGGQAQEADRDGEGPDPDPSGLARALRQPAKVRGRHRGQRTRRAAVAARPDEAALLHGQSAVRRPRLRARRCARRQARRARARGDRRRSATAPTCSAIRCPITMSAAPRSCRR